ncbi:hypothetical protein Q4595_30960, partial [Wenyingzhuangia sp. 1_MG-2023]|nr:hypothetical protein [Wenyingzhuangia sp. 1_MG-2023]
HDECSLTGWLPELSIILAGCCSALPKRSWLNIKPAASSKGHPRRELPGLRHKPKPGVKQRSAMIIHGGDRIHDDGG